MKNSILSEVRLHRMEHTQRFDGNLHRICEDLRKTEQHIANRLVKRDPRRLPEKNNTEQMLVAEEPPAYNIRTRAGGLGNSS